MKRLLILGAGTAGTMVAGATNSETPATVSAEKPKPAKPRTTPAPTATMKPANRMGQGVSIIGDRP